ncbi:MAG: hypothetical protein M0Q91_13825 [Methanoregula sp.]|jgi:hypothetical protein|nr:hypothetical protein [Methanoregula sp.]
MSKLKTEGKLLRVLTIQPVLHNAIFVKTIGQNRDIVLPSLHVEAWDHEMHITVNDLAGEARYIVVIDQKGNPKIYDNLEEKFI